MRSKHLSSNIKLELETLQQQELAAAQPAEPATETKPDPEKPLVQEPHDDEGLDFTAEVRVRTVWTEFSSPQL